MVPVANQPVQVVGDWPQFPPLHSGCDMIESGHQGTVSGRRNWDNSFSEDIVPVL